MIKSLCSILYGVIILVLLTLQASSAQSRSFSIYDLIDVKESQIRNKLQSIFGKEARVYRENEGRGRWVAENQSIEVGVESHEGVVAAIRIEFASARSFDDALLAIGLKPSRPSRELPFAVSWIGTYKKIEDLTALRGATKTVQKNSDETVQLFVQPNVARYRRRIGL